MRFLVWTTLVVACGGGHEMAGDARSGGPVILTITFQGAPRVGVRVYFQNADSSLVASATTDAGGAASAMMAGGGFVTAVGSSADPGTASFDEIDTFSAVQPGDHLTLTAAAHDRITVHVTAPRDSSAGVTGYHVWSSCGDAPLPVVGSGPPGGSVALDACHGMADMLVTAGGTSDFFYAPDQVVADQTTIDLTAHAYTAATPATFAVTNIPAGALGLELSTRVVSPRGSLFSNGGAPPVAPGSMIQLAMPTFPGAVHVVDVAPNVPTVATPFVADWGPYEASHTIDLGARLLTDLAKAAVFDPAMHALAWSEATGGVTPNVAYGFVGAKRGSRTWLWNILAPHDGASIPFPILPGDVFDYNIAAGDVTGPVSIELASEPGGYDVWRTRPLTIGPNANGAISVITGAAGSGASERSTHL